MITISASQFDLGMFIFTIISVLIWSAKIYCMTGKASDSVFFFLIGLALSLTYMPSAIDFIVDFLLYAVCILISICPVLIRMMIGKFNSRNKIKRRRKWIARVNTF